MVDINQMPFLRRRKPNWVRFFFGPFFWIGLGLAVAHWFIDPLIHALMIADARYFEKAFNPEALDLGRRALTSLLLICFGVISSVFFGRMRETQSALIESQAWLKIMSESSFEGLVITENGKVLAINPQACLRLGYAQQDLIGRSFADFVTSDSEKTVRENMRSDHRMPYMLTAIHKDGHQVSVEVRGRNLDYHGRQLRVTALWDVTEQLETRRALQESEARYQILSEAAFEGIVLVKNERIVDANQQMCDMMRTTADRLIGRHILEFSTPETRDGGIAAMQTNDILIFEHELVRGDGSTFPVEVCTRGQVYGDEMIGVAAIRDITSRREAEEQLRKHERQLSNMAAQLALTEERVRRDIAVALHDTVAQQLSAARLKLATIEGHIDGVQHKEFDFLRELLDESIRSTRSLVFDLSPPVLYELGFAAAIEWLADRLKERHGVDCKVVRSGEDIEVDMDEDLVVTLYQLVRELMVNVTKHAHASRASVAVSRDDGNINIRVSDDGRGFDPNNASGGFGLFSIRERLKSVGGELIIDSRPGSGTTAIIKAPLQAKAA